MAVMTGPDGLLLCLNSAETDGAHQTRTNGTVCVYTYAESDFIIDINGSF